MAHVLEALGPIIPILSLCEDLKAAVGWLWWGLMPRVLISQARNRESWVAPNLGLYSSPPRRATQESHEN